MNKTIEIKKTYLINLIVSFILGFGILYGLEHLGKFSYKVNSPPEYDSMGRMMIETLVSGDTKVSNISYKTFFKNRIETAGNGFTISDLNYSNSDFDKYSTKSYYYTQASITDLKYGVFISIGIFIISIFFTNFKFAQLI